MKCFQQRTLCCNNCSNDHSNYKYYIGANPAKCKSEKFDQKPSHQTSSQMTGSTIEIIIGNCSPFLISTHQKLQKAAEKPEKSTCSDHFSPDQIIIFIYHIKYCTEKQQNRKCKGLYTEYPKKERTDSSSYDSSQTEV